ncbi:MAG: general secretion pathway protein GspE [Myxococcales bacterium]
MGAMLIGEILIQSGVLRQDQLDEALEAQVLHGGRIGTNLVELGHATEEQLARALGAQHRVVCAFGEIVPSPEALASVSPTVCDDKDLLPARIDGHKLYLLVLDPDDIEARDQVAVATGLRVMPVVVCEFRMAQLLRRYCKAFRPVREVDLNAVRKKREGAKATELEREEIDLMSEDEFASIYADAMSGKSAAGGEPEELEEALIVEDVIVGVPLPAEEPVVAPVAAAAAAPPASDNAWNQRQLRAPLPHPVAPPPEPLQVQGPPIPAAQPRGSSLAPPVFDDRQTDRRSEPNQGPPPGLAERRKRDRRGPAPVDAAPISFADAQKALAAITDREDIARIVLRFAAGKFRRAMLLNIQGESAIGWLGAGQALAPNAARKVALSLKNASTFKLVRDSRSHFLGPLRRDMTTVMFLKALGEGEPRTALLMPLLAAGRVVNVLYVDQGPGQFTPPDVGELLILAQKVGRSFEAMLAARRKAAPAR